MPKGEMKPEIFILLNMGIKPKNIIKMGYGMGMVYAYNRRFQFAKERLTKLLSNGYDIDNKGIPRKAV